MNISPVVERLMNQPRPDPSEQVVITAKEIKYILSLGVSGEVDNPRPVEDHTVDTYA